MESGWPGAWVVSLPAVGMVAVLIGAAPPSTPAEPGRPGFGLLGGAAYPPGPAVSANAEQLDPSLLLELVAQSQVQVLLAQSRLRAPWFQNQIQHLGRERGCWQPPTLGGGEKLASLHQAARS